MRYLNAANFHYLCQGLTLEQKDLEVIDAVLVGLNTKDGLLERLVRHNVDHGPESTFECSGPQIIVTCDKYLVDQRKLTTATVALDHKTLGLPPVLHINLHSPSLNIPQRVEIPLRYVLEGMIPLKGTFMVYLHALEINQGQTFVYYGITKRGWMNRFREHMKMALKAHSQRKFPKMLAEGIIGRMKKVWRPDEPSSGNSLTASYHVVCAAGRSKQNAAEIERYLIEKRSLAQRDGLNMI